MKFLGKLFWKTPPSNHFSYMMLLLFLFTDHGGLQHEVNSFGEAIREGIHKPIQSCVAKESRWKLHYQGAATHVST